MALTMFIGLLAIGLGSAIADTDIFKYGKIMDITREKSDPELIPLLKNETSPLEIRICQSLLYIVNVDEKNELIELILRQKRTWKNPALAWNRDDPLTNVDNFTIPMRNIWMPPMSPTQAVRECKLISPDLVVVSSSGQVTAELVLRVHLHTDLSKLHTSKGANITITYKSWGYDKSQLKLTSSEFTTEHFESNKFKVSEPTVNEESHSATYDEEFDTITYSFILKKM